MNEENYVIKFVGYTSYVNPNVKSRREPKSHPRTILTSTFFLIVSTSF